MVEVHVWCAQCQQPLVFALPVGVNLIRGATMSLDGTEAWLTGRIGIPQEPQNAVRGFEIQPVL